MKSPQGHLSKTKPCAFRDTCASRVLRVPLGLVEVRVSTERWPGHPRLSKKKNSEVMRINSRSAFVHKQKFVLVLIVIEI